MYTIFYVDSSSAADRRGEARFFFPLPFVGSFICAVCSLSLLSASSSSFHTKLYVAIYWPVLIIPTLCDRSFGFPAVFLPRHARLRLPAALTHLLLPALILLCLPDDDDVQPLVLLRRLLLFLLQTTA